MSGVSVTSELTDVATTFGWGWDDVQTVTERALAAAFVDESERRAAAGRRRPPGYAALSCRSDLRRPGRAAGIIPARTLLT